MTITEEQCKRFARDGFLVLKGVLSGERLAKLSAECMSAWLAEKGEFDAEATWLQNSLLPDIHHRSRLVCDYYFTAHLLAWRSSWSARTSRGQRLN